MAELSPAEKLQPSLLDRLRDDKPGEQIESREGRVISTRMLRDYVIRDLTWLLNTVKLSVQQDLASTPEVGKSVLNYGVSCMTGVSVGRDDVRPIELEVRRAVIDFEPRISAQSLIVRVFFNTEEMGRNAMVIEIEGELWGNPIPTNLYLKTSIDLETGSVNVI
ncbi:MAG: type VI secretion system baseplate subunit TssE [Gammaproteobacteria bacterium]|nr:MAG: type VI secretion system baseplate subunit TssE [Gammaproteobacteria bacterium]